MIIPSPAYHHNSTPESAAAPTFSILMSTYKSDNPDYLREALHSISASQSVAPDEIVLVKDGPLPPPLEQVIKSFQATWTACPVAIIPLQHNSGLGLALREGALACTGDYIVRMDADDISRPNRLEITRSFACAHPDIDAFGGYIAEFTATPGDSGLIRKTPAAYEEIRETCRTKNPMNHVSMCMKRSSLLAAGNYECLPYLEDYLLWIKMLSRGMHLANIPQVLVDVRIGEGFLARRGSKERIQGIDYLQKLMRESKMIGLPKAWENRLVYRCFTYAPAGVKQTLYRHVLRKKTLGRR